MFRLLVSSSVISFVITSVLCYSLWGYYWSKPPYPNLEYGNVSSSSYWTVEDAISDWNNIPITNHPSFYPVISGPPQHVEIHDTYNSTALWDGKCWPSQTSGNIIEHAIIYLNTYYVDSYSYNKKKSLACHELGHVLGLYDVGPYNPVIMNGYTYYRYDVYGISTPQQDDINGVAAIYGG
ncbi:MAG: hypothetical protein FGF53_04030 [Candidatus Brockarchaeota archaeon]|nr:hypothetical protein [Candidatus Brockarchaeota archaeon]